MIKEIKTPKIGLFFFVYNTESNKQENCFRNELSINFKSSSNKHGQHCGQQQHLQQQGHVLGSF